MDPVARLSPAAEDDAPAVPDSRGAPQIQSVVRALTIVEVLARAGRTLALSELCALTGLKRSTAHHLLGTLLARGFVRQDLATREYGIGGRLSELCSLRQEPHQLSDIARGPVRELNQATGEAVHLAVMQGYELVTLLKFDSTHAVRVDTAGPGKSQAAHATATGKAMIAWWPRERLDTLILKLSLRRFTERTITDAALLHGHLARVRKRGWADDIEEFQPGVHCIGAPIRGADASVVAAVSASMPTMRADRRNAARLRELVQHCTTQVSRQLGLHPATF